MKTKELINEFIKKVTKFETNRDTDSLEVFKINPISLEVIGTRERETYLASCIVMSLVLGEDLEANLDKKDKEEWVLSIAKNPKTCISDYLENELLLKFRSGYDDINKVNDILLGQSTRDLMLKAQEGITTGKDDKIHAGLLAFLDALLNRTDEIRKLIKEKLGI